MVARNVYTFKQLLLIFILPFKIGECYICIHDGGERTNDNKSMVHKGKKE